MALLALVGGSPRKATKTGQRGTCIGTDCGAPMISKVGTVIRGHWAHVADTSCDLDDHGEKGWHLTWRTLFYLRGARTEVVMGRHRADIVLADDRVIEFQTTFLAPADIASRETTFGNMAWVYRITDEQSDKHLTNDHPDLGGRLTFIWTTTRLSLLSHRRPLYWHSDITDNVWLIESFTDTGRGAWRGQARIVASDWEEFSRLITEGMPFGDAPTFNGFGLQPLRVAAGRHLHAATTETEITDWSDIECERSTRQAPGQASRIKHIEDDLATRLTSEVEHLHTLLPAHTVKVVEPQGRNGWFVHAYNAEGRRVDVRWVRPTEIDA